MIRFIKNTYQKLTKGYSDEDTWALDISFAKWILPRLKRYKECVIDIGSVPCVLCTGSDDSDEAHSKLQIEWINIIDRMIEGFELIENHFYTTIFRSDEAELKEIQTNKVNDALELFKTYLGHLWW